MSEPEYIKCRVGGKITIEQCRNRQLKRRRYNTSGVLDAHFIGCVSCPNWISDEEYAEANGITKGCWVFNNHVMAGKRKGRGSESCRKI